MTMRAYLCDCDPAARHQPNCPSSPILIDVMLATMFNPWHNPPMPLRFQDTWHCIVHGLLGDINGPVHFEVCGNKHDYEYLHAMLRWPELPATCICEPANANYSGTLMPDCPIHGEECQRQARYWERKRNG